MPSAGLYKRVAAGHFPFLQSHVTREVTCPAILPSAGQAQREKALHPVCAADDDAKKQMLAEKAAQLLKTLPPLPPQADRDTAVMYFSAQIELGNMLLEEGGQLIQAKKLPEAKAKFKADINSAQAFPEKQG